MKSSGPTETNAAPQTNGARLMEGLRVLVTGGSGGIGQGICEVAAREGAQVAFTWRGNQTGADETQTLIRKHGGE
ncbi:MAG TPA: SDR family NAD(P)-dependent oxidoreductase, partial [Pyrinomonadaceae bacterium]